MNREEYINTVLSQMLDKNQKAFVKKEISDHIEDRMDYYMNAGYAKTISEQKAISQMGDAKEIGIKMNMLYDCRKYNTLSLLGLIFLALNIFLPIFLALFRYNGVSVFDSVYDFIASLCYNTMPLCFLVMGLVYLFSNKTKNRNHLIALGILGFMYYIRYIFLWLFGEFSDLPVNPIIELFTETFQILTHEKFYVFSEVSSLIFLLFGIITSIMAIGYGLYVKSYIAGTSKTAVMRHYERYRFVSLPLYLVYVVACVILYILMIKD